jgi:hypothetical protein
MSRLVRNQFRSPRGDLSLLNFLPTHALELLIHESVCSVITEPNLLSQNLMTFSLSLYIHGPELNHIDRRYLLI